MSNVPKQPVQGAINPVTGRVARLPDKAGDWTYARVQYELGIRSLSDIAKDIGVADSTVNNRSQREGWIRDPLARARLQAEREAIEAEKYQKELATTQREVVQVTAVMQSKILVGHREDIKRARRIVGKMMEELEGVTDHVVDFEELGEVLRSENERGTDRLNDTYRKIISMPERSSTMNSLAQALKTLIQLERQAFGISGNIEDPEQAKPPEEVTRGLDKIMSKFDAVLAIQAPAVVPAPVEVVVDVSGQNQAATT